MKRLRHAIMVITTDFKFEPVLKDYIQKYPKGEYKSYQIVFETADEHDEGHRSYIVVLKRNPDKKAGLRFHEFLDAYCKVNERGAVIATGGGIPRLEVGRHQGGEFFGDQERYQKPKAAGKGKHNRRRWQ